MEIGSAISQLKRNMDALEQIFSTHEKFLERLGSAISKYVEVSDIVKPLVEAAGAEIEAKGRASKRTVYGKRGFKGRRGKGIAQYLAEKTWAVGVLIRLIGTERAEASQQARYLYSTLREEESIEKGEEEEEEKTKKMKKKLAKVEGLTKKCEKILGKEASRDKKLIRVTNKEIVILKKVYHLSMREGILARKLVRLIGASRALKILEILFKKEEILFSKFIKEENWIVDDISKELKDIFKLMKENDKMDRILGAGISFRGEEKRAKGEEKVSKRIKKLMKSLKKIQGHIKKIKKGAAKYGVKLEKSVTFLDSEERRLLKEEEEEEKDLAEIDTLLENMERFSTMISRFENAISTSEVGLEPQISWINKAFISAYKIAKKNPSGVLSFLSKVGNFAEKALMPQLKKIDSERREMFKELASDDGVIKKLESDMNIFSKLDQGFKKDLQTIDVDLKKIEKNIVIGNKKAIGDLKRDIKELERSLKEEKKIVRGESSAGAPKTAGEESETKAKIIELKGRIEERERKFEEMKHEFDPAVEKFREAIRSAPEFKFVKGSLFSGGVIDKIVKDIGSAEHYLNTEEGENSEEMDALSEWVSNVSEVNKYVVFVKVLFDSFRDETLLLGKMVLFYGEISIFEKDFSEDVRKMEKMLQDMDTAIRDLSEVMNRYPDLFGEEERDIFNEMNEIYRNSTGFMNELRKTENALMVFAQNLPQVMSSEKRAREHILDMEKLLKESIKNSRKLMKVVGKELQAKL